MHLRVSIEIQGIIKFRKKLYLYEDVLSINENNNIIRSFGNKKIWKFMNISDFRNYPIGKFGHYIDR